MRDVYVIATSCTAFGKRPGDSFKELTGEAYLDVLADARWEDGRLIEQAWFGNCGMVRLASATFAARFVLPHWSVLANFPSVHP